MAEENPRYPANQGDLSSGKVPVCHQVGSLVAQRSLLEASFMDVRAGIAHNSGSQPLFSAKYSWYTQDWDMKVLQ